MTASLHQRPTGRRAPLPDRFVVPAVAVLIAVALITAPAHPTPQGPLCQLFAALVAPGV